MSKVLPFNSIISPGFWQNLFNLSLERELIESRIPIWGYYGHAPSGVNASIFTVDHTSFDEKPASYYNQVAVKGEIITTESLEEFKKLDKNVLIGEKFNLENVEEKPESLARFIILTYADLKSFTFTYWFAFPAISSIQIELQKSEPVPEGLVESLGNSNEVWRSGFFLANMENYKLMSLKKDSGNEIFGYLEPSGISGVAGWVIRNYIAHIIKKRKMRSGDELKILSLQPKKANFSESCIYVVKVEFPDDWEANPKILGWERSGDKLTPKIVDLKSDFDPVTLSSSFVDFNLKLMKWRVFPEFDLEMMHDVKACVLGAGTLGCNVARTLMGWGVRHISIVDSGKVSYSNPVRQSLYKYSDAGKPKAVAAADTLREIFPGVNAEGFEIHIPMPGHPSSPSTVQKIKADFGILEDLIKNNDVIFLLTDTRESRWLPTTLGAAFNKLVINAALGFERYVVLRHGRGTEDLGCYFCTDVVAPGDSTQDRTLDQQCTVTRPGVSMIAAAFAVELLAAVLHFDKNTDNNDPTLGIPPHNIRGWLSTGQQIAPKFQKFDKCSACSEKVVNAYKEEGFELVLKVLNDPLHLENLSGLDKLKEGLDGIMELEDLESD